MNEVIEALKKRRQFEKLLETLMEFKRQFSGSNIVPFICPSDDFNYSLFVRDVLLSYDKFENLIGLTIAFKPEDRELLNVNLDIFIITASNFYDFKANTVFSKITLAEYCSINRLDFSIHEIP